MIVYTGATGSIGSDMPKDCVALTTRLEASVEAMTEELQRVIKKQSAADNVFSFVHLAGLVQVSECEKDPVRARALNVDGTLKWYEAFSKTLAKASQAHSAHSKSHNPSDKFSFASRFVFASTGHVYSLSDTKRRPDSPTDPRSIYAKTKLEAELALKELVGPPITIARIFSVWPRILKPGYLLTSLHEKAKKQDFSPIPGLSNTRDFLTSQEICLELCKLASDQNNEGYQVVNVCSGVGTTIAQVAQKIFAQYGLTKIPPEGPGRATDIKYLVGEPG